MLVLRALTVLALAAAAVLPASSPALADQPPEGAAIGDFQANGNGCRKDAVRLNAEGAAAFTVTYDNDSLSAKAGLGANVTDWRRNCLLSVQLTMPAGYTAAVERMRSFRYADVPATGSVQYRSRIAWGRDREGEWQVTESLTGPYRNYWSSGNIFGPVDYAPCGGTLPLVIDTDLQARASTTDRRVTTSTWFLAGPTQISALYQLDWKPCS
jgi:hypothetical protein